MTPSVGNPVRPRGGGYTVFVITLITIDLHIPRVCRINVINFINYILQFCLALNTIDLLNICVFVLYHFVIKIDVRDEENNQTFATLQILPCL